MTKAKTKPKGIRDELTPKQERFCRYFVELDENATQAALKAGYSKKNARVIGGLNLTKVDIKRYISEIREKNRSIKDHGIATPEELLKSYTRDIRLDPAELFKKDGTPRNIHDIPKEVRLSLSGVTVTEKDLGKSRTSRTYRYRLPVKNQVRDSLAKLIGLTNGNQDIINKLLEYVGITVNVQNNVQVNNIESSGLRKAIEAAKCGPDSS